MDDSGYLSGLFDQPKAELPSNSQSPFTPGWNYGFLHNIPNLKRFENIEGGPPQPGALESFTDGTNVYNVSRQQFEDGSANGSTPVAITKRALANFNTKNGIYNGVKEGSFGQVLNPDGTVQSEGLYHPTRDSEELKKWGTGIAAAVGLILGGTALAGAGAGSAGAGGAAAGGASAGGTGAAASSTFGGLGSGGFGIGAGEGFGSGIVAGEGLGSFGGLGAGAGFGETFGGSMAGLGSAGVGSSSSSMFNNKLFKQLGKQGLKQIISGGGNNSSSGGQTSNGGGMGNMDMGDMFSMFAGLYDANQQGKASDSMRQWMQDQQNYVRNYGAEGTPEFNYLKKTLEAKDAAAGRNSQYGPRSVDLLGQLGKDKLDATARLALGFASPLQRALNQNASKYAGTSAAGSKLLNGNGLSSILNGLGGGNGLDFGGQGGLGGYGTDGTPINGDFFNGDFFGGGVSDFEIPDTGSLDFGSTTSNDDILSFMDGWEF